MAPMIKGALELFLGNAGTAMRPLAAALCLGSNDIVLTGEPRMKERPIGHLVDALRLGGDMVNYRAAFNSFNLQFIIVCHLYFPLQYQIAIQNQCQ